jgi:hypothetical protein
MNDHSAANETASISRAVLFGKLERSNAQISRDSAYLLFFARHLSGRPEPLHDAEIGRLPAQILAGDVSR